MRKLQVFDPPMCCSTGVCGPEVDPALVRFAADLDWLGTCGIVVERFNLTQEPAAFVANAIVSQAMRSRDDALPLLLLDGKVVAQGRHPTRAELAGLLGLAPEVNGAARLEQRQPAASACCSPAGAAPVGLGTPGASGKKCC